ncbi:MAG: DUF5985 family protein [Candidatus Binatia bacterium]
MVAFVNGMISALALVAALFFLRFWRQTRDRFFVLFSLAFFVMALNWVGLSLIDPGDEIRPLFYFARAVAFVVILAAIIDKNRTGTS